MLLKILLKMHCKCIQGTFKVSSLSWLIVERRRRKKEGKKKENEEKHMEKGTVTRVGHYR